MTTNTQLKESMDLKHKILLRKFKLLLIAIQNDNQSFKFTDADLNDVIGNNNVNVDVNFQIDSINLKEPGTAFGITKWDSSNISKILKDVMEILHSCFLNTLEEHEIMNRDVEKRPVWNFAFNDHCTFDEYQLMFQVLDIRPHPSFRFIHEEYTLNKPSYSVITNARGIYLIVVIVTASSDTSQRVIKRQQGLMDAKQLKEQFRLANINNKKVVCVLGAIIINEPKVNKDTIIFVDEKDEAIARAADENYLVNKQVIDEIYLKVTRSVKKELWKQDLSCYDDYENLIIGESSDEEMEEQASISKTSLTSVVIPIMVLSLAMIYMDIVHLLAII